MANSTIGAGARRVANSAFAVLAGLWLAGCSVPDSVNPVNWYRDAMGLSDNDQSDDTRNSGNLAEGSKRDYPNLATVPPPPTRGLSTAERDALTQRLVSDRANAKYIDDQLRGGPSAAVAPPPRPPSSATATATAPAPAEPPAAPREAPAPTAPAVASAAPSSPPTSAPPPTPAPPPAATSTAAPAAKAAPFVSLTAPPPVANATAATAEAPATPAPPAVDESGQPHESPLTSPTVRSVPEPEAPRAAPPPPSLARGSSTAPPPGSAPPRTPAPQLASRRPASEAVAAGGAPVAQVTFPDNSVRLTPSDRRIVGEVVPLQRQNGGALRVVGYAAAGPGAGAAQQLANFRMALDRANAVASALAQAGVASDQIIVETAPPTGESGVAANRAEIFLEN
jgi:outer membrane protein OmpA-like peptidoglycan-associated protein